MKILVLGGGISPERQVSLRSAKAVAEAARTAGFKVIEADPADDLEIIDRAKADMVFPILHGKNGEDGFIQKEIEARNLPFLGTESGASIACFDKWTTRLHLVKNGVNMPKAELVDEKSYFISKLAKGLHALKIVHGGSSIGTLISRHSDETSEQAVNEIFAMEDKAVLEELIIGTEITVPVLDGKALPVIEVVPPPNGEFDYDNKYNGQTQELCPPRSVPADIQKRAQKLAEQVHQLMEARHLSRVDIMINEAGEFFVLEINTMPGMTGQSLYPNSAAVSGLPMPELVKKFVNLVQRDYKILTI